MASSQGFFSVNPLAPRTDTSFGLGGSSVDPGFALQMPIYQAKAQSAQLANQWLMKLLQIGPEGFLNFAQGQTGGLSNIGSDLYNVAIGDLNERERQATMDLQGRFGALGRSTDSSAYSEASTRLGSAFSQQRSSAAAKSALTSADISTRVLQMILGSML